MKELTLVMRMIIETLMIRSGKKEYFIQIISVESTYFPMRMIIETSSLLSRKEEDFIEIQSNEETYFRDENGH